MHGSEGGFVLTAGSFLAESPPYSLPSGDDVCNFSVATNRKWRAQSGENREETTWFRVTVFGRQAQTSAQYLQKGRRVLVTGRVSARAFIGNDGQARASLEVTAQNVTFLGDRDEAGSGGQYGDEPSTLVQPAAEDSTRSGSNVATTTDEVDGFDDDDIPF